MRRACGPVTIGLAFVHYAWTVPLDFNNRCINCSCACAFHAHSYAKKICVYLIVHNISDGKIFWQAFHNLKGHGIFTTGPGCVAHAKWLITKILDWNLCNMQFSHIVIHSAALDAMDIVYGNAWKSFSSSHHRYHLHKCTINMHREDCYSSHALPYSSSLPQLVFLPLTLSPSLSACLSPLLPSPSPWPSLPPLSFFFSLPSLSLSHTHSFLSAKQMSLLEERIRRLAKDVHACSCAWFN